MPGFMPGIHVFFPEKPNQPNGTADFGFTEISLANGPKSLLCPSLSRPERGALANVINAGRDAVDAGGAFDEWRCSVRPSRVVLTPRCWRQVCDKTRRRRCQTSLVTGESTK